MRNQRPEPPLLSGMIDQFKQRLETQYGKNKGWVRTTLEGDGALLDETADTLLQAIKDESTTPTIANMSFAVLEHCAELLHTLQINTVMQFDDKEAERERLHAILKHIQNVNSKLPTNAKEIKENIRAVQANDIWKDIDQIREDSQAENWVNLKKALFVIGCALVIAVIITAMLTPVGWAGVGAFFVGMAAHFFIPYLSKVLATISISIVTFGFMKVARPLDNVAFERELSKRAETEMSTQKRASQDELRKFHETHIAGQDDALVEEDEEAEEDAALLNPPPAAPRRQANDPRAQAPLPAAANTMNPLHRHASGAKMANGAKQAPTPPRANQHPNPIAYPQPAQTNPFPRNVSHRSTTPPPPKPPIPSFSSSNRHPSLLRMPRSAPHSKDKDLDETSSHRHRDSKTKPSVFDRNTTPPKKRRDPRETIGSKKSALHNGRSQESKDDSDFERRESGHPRSHNSKR